jgi:hypothetical protein
MPRHTPKNIDIPEHEGDKQFITHAPRYKAIRGREMAVYCTWQGVRAKYHGSRVLAERRRRTLIFEHGIGEGGKVVYQATAPFCKCQITASTYLYNLESNLHL